MSKNTDDKPEWIDVSLKSIKGIKENLGPVEQEGKDEIRRGLEKINTVRNLYTELHYVEDVLTQDTFPNELWNDEYVTASGIHLSNALNRFDINTQHIPGLLSGGAAFGDDQHDLIILRLNQTSTDSGSAIYMGAGIERRLESINPDYQPFVIVNPPERLETRENLLSELKERILIYGDPFVHMLSGSEEALDSNTPDHLSQASHSMRDLFQQLIEFLAPTKVVKKQPWYEFVDGPQDGVSRRQRLRYMLYGSGLGFEEDIIQQLDETAKDAKESLDLIINRAHNHDPDLTLNEVSNAIDFARFSLNEVLEIHLNK